jgi:hypothetical protein
VLPVVEGIYTILVQSRPSSPTGGGGAATVDMAVIRSVKLRVSDLALVRLPEDGTAVSDK